MVDFPKLKLHLGKRSASKAIQKSWNNEKSTNWVKQNKEIRVYVYAFAAILLFNLIKYIFYLWCYYMYCIHRYISFVLLFFDSRIGTLIKKL